MESRWTPGISKRDFRGQNSMACKVLYIIGKILKRKYLKWALIDHLDIWNTSYGQKKGQESNWQFDSRPEKVRIDPIYLFADNVQHTIGKLSMRATTLHQTAPRSEVCSQSYGAPNSRESPLAWFRDFHVGVPGEKSHLDVGPVKRSRVYYKGEGGGFPKFGLWWVLCVRVVRGSS